MDRQQFRRHWSIISLFVLVLGFFSILHVNNANAHNNPKFKEVLLMTVDVGHQPLADAALEPHSIVFSLDLPKKTIELIWRIVSEDGDGITFAVAQGDKMHAESLTNGASSRILRGDDIRIVNVEGANAPFRVEVFANVIDRSKKSES